MMDDNKAQLAALGAHRCGSPRCPRTLEERLAAAERELDAMEESRLAVLQDNAGLSRQLQRAARALATPADTGWRDRAPSAAELTAHHDAHAVSLLPSVRVSRWLVADDAGHVGLATVTVELIGPYYTLGNARWTPTRWRPLTVTGDPAPWPEVTP